MDRHDARIAREIVIAYAYGASEWNYVDEERAFRQHLNGIDFEFEGINWRPALEPPPAYLLRFLKERRPDRDCDEPSPMRELAAWAGLSALGPEQNDRDELQALQEASSEAAVLTELAAVRAARGRAITGFPFDRTIMRIAYEAIVGDAGVTIADALRYVSAPDEPIDLVARRLESIAAAANGRPVVAVGMSLGGVILVDALARLQADRRKPVALLVTIGSQAAALRAFGVLPLAPPTDPEPALFSPWVNIWHEHDYLSFPVGAIFQHLPDVCDRKARQDGAFPWVHTRYLTPGSGTFDYLREEIVARFDSQRQEGPRR